MAAHKSLLFKPEEPYRGAGVCPVRHSMLQMRLDHRKHIRRFRHDYIAPLLQIRNQEGIVTKQLHFQERNAERLYQVFPDKMHWIVTNNSPISLAVGHRK